MKTKAEMEIGDPVDVRVYRVNVFAGVHANYRPIAHEAWIPGAVQWISDDKVGLYVVEEGTREYPIDSDDWRPAR